MTLTVQAARITYPSVPLTSKAFRYTKAAQTNVAVTIAAARSRMQQPAVRTIGPT